MLGRRRGGRQPVTWSGPLEGLRYEDVMADLDPGWADWIPEPPRTLSAAGGDEPALVGAPSVDVVIAS
jgi:hypothetical protein